MVRHAISLFIIGASLAALLFAGYGYVLVVQAQQASWNPNPATISFSQSTGWGITRVSLTCNPTVITASLTTESFSPNILIAAIAFQNWKFLSTFTCSSNPITVFIGSCMIGVQSWCTQANLLKIMGGGTAPQSTSAPLGGSGGTITTDHGKVHCKDKDNGYEKECGDDENVNINITSGRGETLPQNSSTLFAATPNMFYSIAGVLASAAAAAGAIAFIVRRRTLGKLPSQSPPS